MTKQQLQQYIQSRTVELARTKYPNDQPTEQLHYMIGFLTQQLAEAAYTDNAVIYKFKSAIDKSN